MVSAQSERSYDAVLHKRFTVAVGLDMIRGYSGEELVERTADRFEYDDEVMGYYEHDRDALEQDIRRYVEDHPVDMEDMLSASGDYHSSRFDP